MPVLLAVLLVFTSAPAARAQGDLAICHATGDAANPYIPLRLGNAGVLEHLTHEDDLVPAPAGGCPGIVRPGPTVEPGPTVTVAPEYVVPTPTTTPTVGLAPTATPRPRRPISRPQAPGVVGSPGAPPRAAVAPTVTDTMPEQTATAARYLPRTGSEVWLILLFGLGFLLTGAGLRLRDPFAVRTRRS